MQDQGKEIFIVMLIGSVLALMLVSFIVAIVFLYQRKQHRQEQQLASLKDQYQNELLRSQLEIQEATFKTIAQELHDNIGQVLSVVKLSISILPIAPDHPAYGGAQNCREMLTKVIHDMADLTKSLHTDRISQIGLTEAIKYELDNLKKNGLIEIEYSVSGKEYSLPEQKAIFLFRMFQEIMNNILKHSRAKKMTVSVDYSTGNKFVMRIEDNGIGFDPEKKQVQVSSSSGLGLKNMVNRARLIGATFDIKSQPNSGTVVCVELPLTQTA